MSINLDASDDTFLRLISWNTEVYEDHAIIIPQRSLEYSLSKNDFLPDKQIYLLSSKEEYLSFYKLEINNKINGDIVTFFVDNTDDYLDFVCTLTLEYMANFGWLVSNVKLKNSVLEYYLSEMNSGYFRGLESVKRLHKFIRINNCIPEKVYPWEAASDDEEFMTIFGKVSTKKKEAMKKNHVEKLRKVSLREGGNPSSEKIPWKLIDEDSQSMKMSEQTGICAGNDSEISNTRKMLADRLRKGETVYVTSSGNIQSESEDESNSETLLIPSGKLA